MDFEKSTNLFEIKKIIGYLIIYLAIIFSPIFSLPFRIINTKTICPFSEFCYIFVNTVFKKQFGADMESCYKNLSEICKVSFIFRKLSMRKLSGYTRYEKQIQI